MSINSYRDSTAFFVTSRHGDHKNIKKILKQFKVKNSVKILYGGSVNSKNANEISKIDGIGGLLVGGASLNSKKFVDIIKKTSN